MIVFEGLKPLRIGVPQPVSPLSESRTNRPNYDDVWGLLMPPFRDLF